MKTVICCINSKYVHMSSAPWCLLSGIKTYCREDVTAKVIESTLNSKNDELAVKIAAENPDLVGFCCYIWNISAVLSVAQKLSQITENTKSFWAVPKFPIAPKKCFVKIRLLIMSCRVRVNAISRDCAINCRQGMIYRI